MRRPVPFFSPQRRGPSGTPAPGRDPRQARPPFRWWRSPSTPTQRGLGRARPEPRRSAAYGCSEQNPPTGRGQPLRHGVSAPVAREQARVDIFFASFPGPSVSPTSWLNPPRAFEAESVFSWAFLFFFEAHAGGARRLPGLRNPKARRRIQGLRRAAGPRIGVHPAICTPGCNAAAPDLIATHIGPKLGPGRRQLAITCPRHPRTDSSARFEVCPAAPPLTYTFPPGSPCCPP